MASAFNSFTNIKIISDGINHKVTLEDGTLLLGVTAVRLVIKAGEIAKVELDICPHSVEVQAQLNSIHVEKFN